VSASIGAVRLVPVDLAAHRPALLDLNVEYLAWVEQVCDERCGVVLRGSLGVDVRTYREGSLDAMVTAAQRHASRELVAVDGAPVDTGALRHVDDDGAEVERMYVRPGHRGRRLGATLLAKLVEDDRSLGYDAVRLDAGQCMTAAHRTYAAVGFVDRGSFEAAEVSKGLWPHVCAGGVGKILGCPSRISQRSPTRCIIWTA